jgi:hypothetical protein
VRKGENVRKLEEIRGDKKVKCDDEGGNGCCQEDGCENERVKVKVTVKQLLKGCGCEECDELKDNSANREKGDDGIPHHSTSFHHSTIVPNLSIIPQLFH